MAATAGILIARVVTPIVRRLPDIEGKGGEILVILGALCLAVLFGMATPVLGVFVPALATVGALSIVVLAMSPRLIVWLMLVLVLLVVGQLTFFLNIQKAAWVPYLLLLLMIVKYLAEQLRLTRHVPSAASANRPSAISALLICFGLVYCLSAVANATDPASVGVAAKNYIFPWFLTMLVAATVPRSEDLHKIWTFLLWVAVLQIPFALVQRFHYAKMRGTGDSGLDAVVGTFGGAMFSGGASGAMVVFLVFAIILAAALYHRRQIGWGSLAGVILAAGITVALAEVKIFFVILPAGLLFLFRMKVLASPGKSILYGLLAAVFLAAIGFAYQQTASNRLGKARSIEGYVAHALGTESDPYMYNPVTKELSRVGAILMWARYNSPSNPRFYIGHGPAASRKSQTLGIGVAARKYPFTLTTSTASTLLWDIGLGGFGLFVALLAVSGFQAFGIAKSMPDREKAALESIGTMLLLGIPLSFYNRDLIDSPVMQTMLAFWLGYILLCRRTLAGTKTAQAPIKQFPPSARKVR